MTIKLTAEQVQQIRQFHRTGFSPKTIGECYSITAEQVNNIVSGRCWKFLPVVDVALPTLAGETASKLRHARKLTAAQRQAIHQYHQHLTATIEQSAEAEGHAIDLLREWCPLPKRRRGRKSASLTRSEPR
jgi:DNA-binding transcriptional MerR regulator